MENDGKNILSNKWVWIGGAAVLALLFFMGNSGSSSASSSGATAIANSVAANNANATSIYGAQLQSATALGEAAYQYKASIASSFFGMLGNLNQTSTNANAALAESTGGVIASIANSNSQVAMDIATNEARVNNTGIQAIQSIGTTATNATASQRAAQDAASAASITSLTNGITNLLGRAIPPGGIS